MSEAVGISFPVPPIKIFDRYFAEAWLVDIAEINAVTIWIRPRYVKWFDSTGLTEVMLGNPGVESIKTQVFPTGLKRH